MSGQTPELKAVLKILRDRGVKGKVISTASGPFEWAITLEYKGFKSRYYVKKTELIENPKAKKIKRKRKPMTARQRAQFEKFLASKGKSVKKKRRTVRSRKPIRTLKIRARKNPLPKFIVCANSGAKHWYYRQSTGSLVDTKSDATNYKTLALASRAAKSILSKLPARIKNLTVEKG